MGMASLYLGLLTVAALLWWSTKKLGRRLGTLKQAGGLRDMLQRQPPETYQHNSQPEADGETMYQHVEAVLDDIYREFTQQIKAVKLDISAASNKTYTDLLAELEGLRGEVAELTREVTVLRANPKAAPLLALDSMADSTPEPAEMHHDGAIDAFDPRYFQILDELRQSDDIPAIARKLGLGIREVELVRQLMPPLPLN